MMGTITQLGTRFFPPVPEEIRDEFVLNSFARLQAQVPLLYALLILLVVTAMLGASEGTPDIVRYGIPVAVICASFLRLVTWMKRRKAMPSPDMAAKLIRSMVIVSGLVAVLCSAWCLISWFSVSPDVRAYLPLFMAMGSLSTAYCISPSRRGALTNLVIGVPPISIALLLSGSRMDIAAACSLLVAAGFLVRLILQQHTHLVDLLMLQRQMRELAETDALTGLTNRRALYARLEHEIAVADDAKGPALVLLDLDGFKPINDQYGHATGDEVLRQVSARFRQACDKSVTVARLGGDEFALLLPGAARLSPHQAADQALASLVHPFETKGLRLRVGASAGIAVWPHDAITPESLISVADQALYAAKAEARAPYLNPNTSLDGATAYAI